MEEIQLPRSGVRSAGSLGILLQPPGSALPVVPRKVPLGWWVYGSLNQAALPTLGPCLTKEIKTQAILGCPGLSLSRLSGLQATPLAMGLAAWGLGCCVGALEAPEERPSISPWAASGHLWASVPLQAVDKPRRG